MKQLLQNLRTGVTEVAEVPAPTATRGTLVIQTRASLISAGTERMLIEFSKAGLIGKAKAQPEKVRQVLDKIRADGLLPTLEAVFNRLDEPLPLGYCNAGVVLECGVRSAECGMRNGDFRPGDRVVSNGPHAEIVAVPRNLCAKIPDHVTDEQAVFTVLGSIGLQGVRLLQPTLGERFVVYGLGLIGLVGVQFLRAHGCAVLGVDLNAERLVLAEQLGAETVNAGAGGDPVVAVNAWTNGMGADGVLITASAKTDEIVHQSAQACRKRGRIVLVGVVGMNLRRSDFYEKELSFQVSCSYGPGRYDERYEQGGQDYPLPFVRWTAQRNFQAVLDLLASGGLQVDKLITHRYPVAEAARAYATVGSDPNALAVILQYPSEVRRDTRLVVRESTSAPSGRAVLGVLGAGNYAKLILLPALAKTTADLKYVCDLNGAAAAPLVRKFRAGQAVTDYRLVLQDPAVNAVLIVVGHQLHARFVCEALRAGKHVFVEKPLAMNLEELRQIVRTRAELSDDGYQLSGDRLSVNGGPERGAGSREQGAQRTDDGGDSPLVPRHSPLLMVGFNRRFSPHTQRLRELLAGRSEPLAMTMTINAGFVPPEHWVHDPVRGGGRIIGEACHFIDLMVCLAGSPVRTVAAVMMEKGTATREDKMSMVLGFEDGSVGTVNYFANGSKAYPKERLEVFSEGRVARLENFRRTVGFGFKRFRSFQTWRQDKGHAAEFAAFVKRVAEGGGPLIPLAELVNVTLASFAAMTAARERRIVSIREEYAGKW